MFYVKLAFENEAFECEKDNEFKYGKKNEDGDLITIVLDKNLKTYYRGSFDADLFESKFFNAGFSFMVNSVSEVKNKREEALVLSRKSINK